MQIVKAKAKDIKPKNFVFSAKNRMLCQVVYVVPEDCEGRIVNLENESHTLKRVCVAYVGDDVVSDEFNALDLVCLGVGVDGLEVQHGC